MKSYFDRSIDESIASINSLRESWEAVNNAVNMISRSLQADGTIFFIGNGGSAADAQHAAAELVGRLGMGVSRKPLRAIALTTDTSALTAIANDFGFDQIFSRQLKAIAKPGDVLVAITTSGQSANILHAAQYAVQAGVHVISLLGPNRESVLAKKSQIAIHTEGLNTPRIQEAQGLALHIICELVEKEFAE